MNNNKNVKIMAAVMVFILLFGLAIIFFDSIKSAVT